MFSCDVFALFAPVCLRFLSFFKFLNMKQIQTETISKNLKKLTKNLQKIMKVITLYNFHKKIISTL